MTIGQDLRIYDVPSIVVDETRPWLITIGDHVRLTHGVVILTHDFSKCVLNIKYNENIGEGAETVIGNNCFVGNYAIILMGTKIGNNVIVGAGSVVHGNIPDDVVIAGNPAKVICSIEDFLLKRREKSSKEAIQVAIAYIKKYQKPPTKYEMRHFQSLFEGDYKATIQGNVKTWKDYTDFVNEVIETMSDSNYSGE